MSPGVPSPGVSSAGQAQMQARRAEVERARDRRRLRWVLPLLAVAVVVGAGLAVVHGGLFEARQRTVEGAVHTPPAAIWAAAGIGSSTPLIDISPARAAARVEALPWVVHATVHLHWPDAVTITVVEGTPVATVRRGPVEMVVDAQGRVLGPRTSLSGGSTLPLLQAPGPVPPPGSVLGPAARVGVAVAAALPPMLKASVQQVTVSSSKAVDLVLSGSIIAELGTASQIPAELASLVAVLSDPESAPTVPSVIDVEDPPAPTVAPISAAQASHT